MILTSPSVSLAYDIVWSDIWRDMVKMIRGEQCTDRDQMLLYLKIWHSEGGWPRPPNRPKCIACIGCSKKYCVVGFSKMSFSALPYNETSINKD